MKAQLEENIKKLSSLKPTNERIELLNPLITYVQNKVDSKQTANLNFICTHNSRRSQFAQMWAAVAAHKYGVPVNTFSGGVEVTAFNKRAIASAKRFGLEINALSTNENPIYELIIDSSVPSIKMFSKLFDHPINNAKNFAAVMTCSHADENCPFIPGTEKRIALNYNDPKAFDGTNEEANKYDERSEQIAQEMLYTFSKIKLS